jgi:hypothetical protein
LWFFSLLPPFEGEKRKNTPDKRNPDFVCDLSQESYSFHS